VKTGPPAAVVAEAAVVIGEDVAVVAEAAVVVIGIGADPAHYTTHIKPIGHRPLKAVVFLPASNCLCLKAFPK
jgi:hypothetical protein